MALRDCTVQEKSLVDSEFNPVMESAQATRDGERKQHTPCNLRRRTAQDLTTLQIWLFLFHITSTKIFMFPAVP